MFIELEDSEFGLESVYSNYENDNEPMYTAFKIRENKVIKRTLDYIWYSKGNFIPTQRLSIPSEDQVGEDGLPSESYPSDHMSLACKFKIKKQLFI